MKGLFSLMLASTVSFSFSSCPSNDYIYCAREGNTCHVPGSIDEGYISYGANGRYTLVPFSNKNGGAISVGCDNDFGDVLFGVTKHCCYIEADTQFDITAFGNFMWEGAGGWNFGGVNPYSMEYGANNKYVFRVIAATVGWCNNDFFNDIVPGVRKHCKYTSHNPSILDSTQWYLCSNEGGDCNGLDSSAHWIRYGAGDDFYYRLVVSSDGKVPCHNDFFDDPKGGTPKYCWRSETSFSFSPGYGSWQRVPSCGGCSSNQYTKTVGIEELTESTMSNSWSLSLEAKLKKDYKFAGVELTATVATSVTNTIKNSFKKSVTYSTTYTCSKDTVYQWVTDVEQSDGIGKTNFRISSEDFWCIDAGLTPKCPPGYCQDSNCQQCIN